MHRLLAIINLCLLLLIHVNAHDAEAAGAKEIQAAFLVKFTAYVTWPAGTFADPDSSLIISIHGRDPFGTTIDNIARSYSSNGRNVEIRRCPNMDKSCSGNIIYIVPSGTDKGPSPLSVANSSAALLVGNEPKFLERGGMINFVKVGRKIRFDISKTNINKAGLEISSKLLNVARAIH